MTRDQFIHAGILASLGPSASRRVDHGYEPFRLPDQVIQKLSKFWGEVWDVTNPQRAEPPKTAKKAAK